MISTSKRERSKSSKRAQIKSPLSFKNKIDLEQKSSTKKLNCDKINVLNRNIDEKRILRNDLNSSSKGSSREKINCNLWTSSQNFKNKLLVSSNEFNRIKNQFKTSSNSINSNLASNDRKPKHKKIKIKILDKLQKKSSSANSDKTNTHDNSNNSSQSEEIIQLKIQNQHFKKIYDDALGQLKKLEVQLKQQKKVHDVQKHIYQTKLNKFKKVFESQKETVSHIIIDDQQRCIAVIENDQSQELGIFSDQDDQLERSFGSLSIQSK